MGGSAWQGVVTRSDWKRPPVGQLAGGAAAGGGGVSTS